MPAIKFKIKELTCPACVTLSQEALSEIPGVLEVKVDLENSQAEISSEREIAWPEISQALKSIHKEAIALGE